MSEFRRTGERQVHQGYVWRVVVAEFEAPDGSTFTRDIVRSPGAGDRIDMTNLVVTGTDTDVGLSLIHI